MCYFQDKVSSTVNPRNLISETLAMQSLSYLMCINNIIILSSKF